MLLDRAPVFVYHGDGRQEIGFASHPEHPFGKNRFLGIQEGMGIHPADLFPGVPRTEEKRAHHPVAKALGRPFGSIQAEDPTFRFPAQERGGQIHPHITLPQTHIRFRRLALPVRPDDFRTDDTDFRTLLQFVDERVDNVVRDQMEVIVREEQDVHVRMGAKRRGAGIATRRIAIVLPNEHLAARPLPEGFRLRRITAIVDDHEPVRNPDPGDFLPDETLSPTVITIIDDNDADHTKNVNWKGNDSAASVSS